MPVMDNVAGNFFLIGLMGAGKSTLGKLWADQIGYTFYDSDLEICSRTGVSIPVIFELEGEAGFRQREAAMIRELANEKNVILATGGGAILQIATRRLLREKGTVVYLHAKPELLFERTLNDKNRPLLQVADPRLALNELYQARDPLYRAAAHHIIQVDEDSCRNNLLELQTLSQNHAHAHR